jgi:hypothetical protein
MKPRLFAAILLMLLLDAALAVSPLVTDDADTVEPAHLQLNTGWQFSRTGSASLSAVPVNPVLGLNLYGELGTTFGYQWSDGPTQADGITDLLISTKWRLWHGSDDILRISARFDLKAPTASTDRGLGTGKTDGGIVLIATGSWGTNFPRLEHWLLLRRCATWCVWRRPLVPRTSSPTAVERALDTDRRNIRSASAHR